MFELHLNNIGSVWHFKTFEEALAKGRSTGFECSIWKDGKHLHFIKVI